ncbi:MAG TPA: hypothetical protein VIQ81_04105 [Gammaproteobacteria bacterium]
MAQNSNNQNQVKQPTGRVLSYFRPTETFECEENGSVYVKGQRYQVREGNEQLQQLVADWEELGKVERG